MSAGSNLILIGMPASGKSTVGVLAAKALGMDFADTDLLLQRQEGLRLHEILEQRGPQGFLALEDTFLATFQARDTVVSTGGSAVYHRAGMENLRRLGTVIWLDVPLAEIQRRLGDISTRGVVLGPGQSLGDLYEERYPLYARWSDIRVEAGREDLETTVGKVVASCPRRGP